MRIWVLLLMIALLPLRVVAAEGMAVRMAQAQAQGVLSAQTEAMASEGMPEDCPMMAGASGSTQKHDGEAANYCTACYIFAVAVRSAGLDGSPLFSSAGPSWSALSPYADAELAPDLRPPILS